MRQPKVLKGLVISGTFVLATLLNGCGAEANTDVEPAQTEDSTTVEETIAVDKEALDPYIDRLSPIAKLKQATDITVEGDDAWVSVPVPSTSPNAQVTCLQLLPARAGENETLTVIYDDGVEEVCEWPEAE